MLRFSAVVRLQGRNLCLDLPDPATHGFLPFAEKGRIRISGQLNGTGFNATLMPSKARGHILYLPGGLRTATGVKAGDVASVELQPHTAQQVNPPGELASALEDRPGAAGRWVQLPVAQRRELARFIDDARSQATRKRRVDQVITQLVGATVLPPGRRTGRPLWTCPNCGQAFVTRNMNHSCSVHSLDEPFRGKPPGLRQLFDVVRQVVEATGPVTLVPYRDRINFMVRVRFAGAKPARNWLDVDFWLTRRIESPRFRKVETLTPYTHIHTVRVTAPPMLTTNWLGGSAKPTKWAASTTCRGVGHKAPARKSFPCADVGGRLNPSLVSSRGPVSVPCCPGPINLPKLLLEGGWRLST